jgi:acyl-[acyl carrier protein]--UDP-N-acetylglucosamine O-acyltransferase
MGLNQAKVHGSTNFDTSKLVIGVSCAHKWIIIGNRCNVGTKSNW